MACSSAIRQNTRMATASFPSHDRELRGIIAEMNTENSNAAIEIQKSVDQMAHAWPTLQPPGQPAMSKPVLRALVTAVELNSRRFAR